jgi:hypothetical protein
MLESKLFQKRVHTVLDPQNCRITGEFSILIIISEDNIALSPYLRGPPPVPPPREYSSCTLWGLLGRAGSEPPLRLLPLIIINIYNFCFYRIKKNTFTVLIRIMRRNAPHINLKQLEQDAYSRAFMCLG